MKDIKIKDVNLVSEITGNEKIPVSNGSGKPAAITVNLILNKVPNTSNLATKDEIPNIIYFNPETFNAEKFEELSSLLWPDGDGLSHTLVVCLDRNEGGVTAYVCDVRDYDAECIYLSYLRPGAPLSPLDSFDHIPFFVDQYKLLKDGTIDKYTLVMTKPDRLPISTLPSEATLEEVVTAYNDLVSKLIEIGTLIEPDDDVVVEED